MKPGCRQVVHIQVGDAVRHPTEGYGVIVWCPGGVEDLIERLEANLAILVPGLGVEDRERRTPAGNRGNRQAAARVIPAAGGLDELDAGKCGLVAVLVSLRMISPVVASAMYRSVDKRLRDDRSASRCPSGLSAGATFKSPAP